MWRLWHLKEAVKAEDRRRLISINYHLLGCDMIALSTANYELPKPSDLGEELQQISLLNNTAAHCRRCYYGPTAFVQS